MMGTTVPTTSDQRQPLVADSWRPTQSTPGAPTLALSRPHCMGLHAASHGVDYFPSGGSTMVVYNSPGAIHGSDRLSCVRSNNLWHIRDHFSLRCQLSLSLASLEPTSSNHQHISAVWSLYNRETPSYRNFRRQKAPI